MSQIKVVPIHAFNDNYIWLLINDKKKEALCVDAGDSAPVLNYLSQNNLTLKALLITHHHLDHIGGAQDLIKKYPNISIYGPNDKRISHITHPVKHHDVIDIINFANDFKVIETPGHTTSHICFYSQTLQSLFCGDTLFSAGCGRLFEGTAKEMLNSLNQLAALADETKIYPAHEYTKSNLAFALSLEPNNAAMSEAYKWANQVICTLPSTMGKEKRINPFLRTNQYIKEKPSFLPQSLECLNEVNLFQWIREQKDCF